jgi:hypothetical protein
VLKVCAIGTSTLVLLHDVSLVGTSMLVQSEGRFTLWTMKLSHGRLWTLKLSRDDLGLHQGKNDRVTTEVEVLKI